MLPVSDADVQRMVKAGWFQLARHRPLTSDTLKVLAVFRANTGNWLPRPFIRQALGLDPTGFGEPIVQKALAELMGAGIHIEESVTWVYFGSWGRMEVWPPGELGTPAEVTETVGGGRLWSRENVYRLP